MAFHIVLQGGQDILELWLERDKHLCDLVHFHQLKESAGLDEHLLNFVAFFARELVVDPVGRSDRESYQSVCVPVFHVEPGGVLCPPLVLGCRLFQRLGHVLVVALAGLAHLEFFQQGMRLRWPRDVGIEVTLGEEAGQRLSDLAGIDHLRPGNGRLTLTDGVATCAALVPVEEVALEAAILRGDVQHGFLSGGVEASPGDLGEHLPQGL